MPVASYDPSTPAGLVRLLISDIPSDDGHVFDDVEVAALLDLRDGDVKLAAALGLRTIAANEVLVQKRLTLLDARTDGPAEAKALVELADRLEAEVDSAGAVEVA